MCTCGCWSSVLAPIVANCACRSMLLIGTLSQVIEPSAWMNSVCGVISSGFEFGLGWGRSILMSCSTMGAVIMKMTSSTSMMSISGVMLMSATGPPALLVLMAMNESSYFFAAGGLAEAAAWRGIAGLPVSTRADRKSV